MTLKKKLRSLFELIIAIQICIHQSIIELIFSTTNVTYKTTTDKLKANGTSLQGYIQTTFDKLVELLGEPLKGSDDCKTTAEWIVEVEGQVATIYDWKLQSTPKDLYNWHVGGRSLQVIEHLSKALGVPARTY